MAWRRKDVEEGIPLKVMANTVACVYRIGDGMTAMKKSIGGGADDMLEVKVVLCCVWMSRYI